jgi:hypothetical protein
MTDVVTPNFREKIRKGEIIMNPCSRTTSYVSRSQGGNLRVSQDGAARWANYGGGGSLTHWFTSKSDLAPVIPPLKNSGRLSDLISESKMRAISAIDKSPHAFLEDILTFKQTLRFMHRPFSDLADLADDFQKTWRKYRRRPGKAAKSLANLWLEYRFAATPFLMSLNELYLSLTNYVQRPSLGTAHGVSVFEFSQRDSPTDSSGAWGYSLTRKRKIYVRSTILYSHSNPISDWRSVYGLRGKDVPRVVWDLVPYSFMLDRVLDIGTSISALSNIVDPNVVIQSGCYSTLITDSQELSLTRYKRPGWSYSLSPDVDSSITESYNRSVWAPTVLDVAPTFTGSRLVKDATSISDLATLVYQRFSGKNNRRR